MSLPYFMILKLRSFLIVIFIFLSIPSTLHAQPQTPFFTATLRTLNVKRQALLEFEGHLINNEVHVQNKGQLILKPKRLYQFAFRFSFIYEGKEITEKNYAHEKFDLIIDTNQAIFNIPSENRHLTDEGFEFAGMLLEDSDQDPVEVLIKKGNRLLVKAQFKHRSNKAAKARLKFLGKYMYRMR